jgi:hypothetical protein
MDGTTSLAVDFFFFDFRLTRSTLWRKELLPRLQPTQCLYLVYPFHFLGVLLVLFRVDPSTQFLSFFRLHFLDQTKKKASKNKRRKAERQEGTGNGHTTRDIASNKKR